jgi:hypothetical protein
VKYVDDATIWEHCDRDGSNSLLQGATNEWSIKNRMKVNTDKTKVMKIYFGKKTLELADITMDGCILECVETFKALGVVFNSKLTWHDHVFYMIKKTSKRLYLLVLLRRAGLSTEDLVQVYQSIIRSVLEYAVELWHPGLSKEQSDNIEHVQKRALHIIQPGVDYDTACAKLQVQKLKERRDIRCREFFLSIQNTDHKLNYLLPKQNQCTKALRKSKKYPLMNIKTNRYRCSPINYGVFHYQ